MCGISDTTTDLPTMADLTNQLADLQARVENLSSKLTFGEMAVLTLEASELNMKGSISEGMTIYSHEIKIDHPLCNNNPAAIVLVVQHADNRNLRVVNVNYKESDNAWYITIPDKDIRGYELGIIVDPQPTVIPGLTSSDTPAFKKLSDLPFHNNYGIGYVGPIWPQIGQRFSVAIFTPLPVTMKPKLPAEPPIVINLKIIDLSGAWNYSMSSTSGSIFTGIATLAINETAVTGNFSVQDNTRTSIVGTFINNALSILRDTGLDTVQVMNLTGIDANHFTGTYNNQGKWADSGTISLSR